MSVPSNALKYASDHHGLITGKVLAEADLTPDQVTHLVQAGQIHRVHRGVYRTAAARETWEQAMLAACLVAGGVASHRSAQRLWEKDPPRAGPTDWPIDVTVAGRRAPRLKGVTAHSSSDLDVDVCPRRNGIPVTTPMRMLLDLGAVESAGRVAEVLEDLIIRRVVPVAAVRRELEVHGRKGRTGTGILRQVVDEWQAGDEKADSSPERTFVMLCRKAGLPEPVAQYEVVVGGRRRKIDCAYPDRLIAIEIDGFATHAQRETFQDDRSRQNDLIRAGWQVLRFTWHDVTRRPEHVAATVRAMLSAADGAA